MAKSSRTSSDRARVPNTLWPVQRLTIHTMPRQSDEGGLTWMPLSRGVFWGRADICWCTPCTMRPGQAAKPCGRLVNLQQTALSDSVKRHLRGRHLSVLNLKFDFISDCGCTREEQIALSLKRHLFPHGGREPKAFWICFSRVHPPSEIKSNFKFKTLKRRRSFKGQHD